MRVMRRVLSPAGPLALAREILEEDGEPFFVLNSDITCEYPLADLLAFHKNHGKEGTIMVRRDHTSPCKTVRQGPNAPSCFFFFFFR
jgi:mannose-1-phosphate guanylyltransferase